MPRAQTMRRNSNYGQIWTRSSPKIRILFRTDGRRTFKVPTYNPVSHARMNLVSRLENIRGSVETKRGSKGSDSASTTEEMGR